MITSGRGVLPFARFCPPRARLTYGGSFQPQTAAQAVAARSYYINPTVQSRYPSSRNTTKPFPRFVRYCSHRRALNMCKHFGHEADASSSIDVTKGREVLPKNVKPVHYDLTLEPKLDGDFTYEGKVVIEYVSFICSHDPTAY